MNNLPNELVGKTGTRRDSKKTKLTRCYKREEVVKSHDYPRFEGTLHIDRITIEEFV